MNTHMFSAALKMARYSAIPLLAFLALAAWAVSSPVGSSPDEDYHLVSIWCGHGTEPGKCESAPQADERKVPEALPNAPCYAFHAETSASCQEQWFYNESHRLVPTDRGNFTGDYPPVFYFVMSSFVGGDISESVILMRLVNAALFVGLMTLTYRLLPPGRRTMLVVGASVTFVPLSAFIVPSINPSSWAVISSAVIFPVMVGFFETSGRRKVALAAVAALAILIGAGARADAAVYSAIAVLLAAVLSAAWSTRSWKSLAFPPLLLVACVAFYLSAGQSSAASQVGAQNQPGMDKVHQIIYNLLNVPSLWAGSFGSWNLGWLDTGLPPSVWVINLITFGGILAAGIRHTTVLKNVAVLVVLFATWLIPTWVLLQTQDLVGAGVQPRYILPLILLLIQVALLRVDPRRADISRSQLLFMTAALSVTNAISLHYNIQRYVIGGNFFKLDLDTGREWWWAIPISPMGVWLLGSVTFAAALFLCTRVLMPRRDRAVDAFPGDALTTSPEGGRADEAASNAPSDRLLAEAPSEPAGSGSLGVTSASAHAA